MAERQEQENEDDEQYFAMMLAHEYIESRLIEEGIQFNSPRPECWQELGPDDYYEKFVRGVFHAHYLAPKYSWLTPFEHYEAYGLPTPDLETPLDLENLETVVNVILETVRSRR
jgi:hypothetical protein